jgi:ferredoxin
MRIMVDEAKCCGSGQCVVAAPQVFDQRDQDGVVVIVNQYPPDTLKSEIERAVRLCPSLAIWVEK